MDLLTPNTLESGEKNKIEFIGKYKSCLYPKPFTKTLEPVYSVLKFKIVEVYKPYHNDLPDEIIVVGEIVDLPSTAINYHMVVTEQINPKYGKEYQIEFMQAEINYDNVYEQKAFLSTFLSQRQITNLYDTLPNPFEVIKNEDTDSLEEVPSIGKYTANKIIEKYNKNISFYALYSQLDDYNFTIGFLQRVLTYYRDPETVVNIIKNNPYDMIGKVQLVGFTRADEIALQNPNFSPKSPRRISAFISYFLDKEAQDNGQSYVTKSRLLKNIYKNFGGKDEIVDTIILQDGTETNNIEEGLKALIEKGLVCTCLKNDEEIVYLAKIKQLEQNIANELYRLLSYDGVDLFADSKKSDWKSRVEQQERKQGFKFDETQQQGIQLALEKNVILITGGGGCGKSSLLAGILSALGNHNCALTALSGKASANLKEITGKDTSTIHRLLGDRLKEKDDDKEKSSVSAYKDDYLDYDIVVVDEISMVGGEIFYSLIKVIKGGAKLILIGDFAQLEAIGLLNLGKDLYDSSFIPKVELTTIHRQAAMSGIITSSYNVRRQCQIAPSTQACRRVVGDKKDMVYDFSIDKSDNDMRVLGWFKKLYNSDYVQKDINKIQILSPVNSRGSTSVACLNSLIQSVVNPVTHLNMDVSPYVEKKLDAKTSIYIQKNDKIMCVKNNYNLEVPIFNGWSGILTDLDYDLNGRVYFPIIDKEIEIPADVLSEFVLSYACTVHKSQGQTIPVVIGVLNYDTPPMMLTNNMLYTMITRASDFCVIIGQSSAIAKSIATNFVSQKRTFLPELLREFEGKNNIILN